MTSHDDINHLREALRLSPDNVHLRKYLADLLYSRNLFAEAEQEYKEALQREPGNQAIKLGLAKSFYQLDKVDAASIVVEELMALNSTDPELYLLHARISFRHGNYADAKDSYMIATALNHQLKDKDFEEELDKVQTGKAHKIPLTIGDMELPVVDKEIESSQVTFKDVGGMDRIKEEIALKVIYPLKNPAIYKAYGKKAGGGILMYGPPGCGKTHLARATAGEIEASFISVGINDILDMWVGSSEKKLNGLFRQARASKPCVLFFDEVDALGASRSDMRRSEGRSLINQFLQELDGVDTSNEGILVLAATNSPWYLDNAFRRPGRFDRLIFVPPPDREARVNILGLLLKEIPVKSIDFEAVAKQTEDYSGADLKAVVEIAVEAKIMESLKTGTPAPITTADLKNAIGRHKPTTKEWFATAKNYALYANEGGVYDDILKYLKIKK